MDQNSQKYDGGWYTDDNEMTLGVDGTSMADAMDMMLCCCYQGCALRNHL